MKDAIVSHRRQRFHESRFLLSRKGGGVLPVQARLGPILVRGSSGGDRSMEFSKPSRGRMEFRASAKPRHLPLRKVSRSVVISNRTQLPEPHPARGRSAGAAAMVLEHDKARACARIRAVWVRIVAACARSRSPDAMTVALQSAGDHYYGIY